MMPGRSLLLKAIGRSVAPAQFERTVNAVIESPVHTRASHEPDITQGGESCGGLGGPLRGGPAIHFARFGVSTSARQKVFVRQDHARTGFGRGDSG
jgi:hypothetical protein